MADVPSCFAFRAVVAGTGSSTCQLVGVAPGAGCGALPPNERLHSSGVGPEFAIVTTWLVLSFGFALKFFRWR